MSRIGRLPIEIPSNVKVEVKDGVVTVSGPLGTLTQVVDTKIKIEIVDNTVVLSRENETNEIKAKHGLFRALIANMVKGVTEGFEKKLIFNGVGYRIQKTGNKIVMKIGFSHSINFEEEPGITIDVISNNEVVVKGIDKHQVGQVAASIRVLRPVEPYHAYGIRYSDEVVIRKVGKVSGKK